MPRSAGRMDDATEQHLVECFALLEADPGAVVQHLHEEHRVGKVTLDADDIYRQHREAHGQLQDLSAWRWLAVLP